MILCGETPTLPNSTPTKLCKYEIMFEELFHSYFLVGQNFRDDAFLAATLFREGRGLLDVASQKVPM